MAVLATVGGRKKVDVSGVRVEELCRGESGFGWVGWSARGDVWDGRGVLGRERMWGCCGGRGVCVCVCVCV